MPTAASVSPLNRQGALFASPVFLAGEDRHGFQCDRLRVAPYLISPASLGSVRLISGMQMMSSSPANSASIYGT